MRRIRKVHIHTSEGFYNLLNEEKKKFQKQIGLNNIPFPIFTEMLAKSRMKFQYPKLDVVGLKNVKRKKSGFY